MTRCAPPVRAAADWLALRAAADASARAEGAAHLLATLVQHLQGRGVGSLEVVDVGAVTGANARYLRPRLPFRQRWVVVDHDPAHLDDDAHGDAVRVAARVRDLPCRFADLPVNAQAYVRRLEELSGARISVIGVGPGRDQNVVLHDLLA